MDSSISSTNWNNLPIEIKLEIIKKLDMNSRLALRACSTTDFEIVESVPFRKVHMLKLSESRSQPIQLQISLSKTFYSSSSFSFDNFKAFQKKLNMILDKVEYIGTLVIDMKNTKNIHMKLGTHKIKIRKATIAMNRAHSLLRKVDSSILKYLDFQSYYIKMSSKLYDMPQVNSVDGLRISGSNIKNDQLMKLNSKKLKIENPGILTSSGICYFIKKQTSDPNCEQLSFSWLSTGQFDEIYDKYFTGSDRESEEYSIHPIFTEFETRLSETDGMIEMRRIKADSLKPRKVESMRIDRDYSALNRCYCLTIEETWDYKNKLVFGSTEELQKQLTETMKTINYIKRLEVFYPHEVGFPGWRLISQKHANQITVGHVLISNYCKPNGTLFVDLLEQIEPGHLKSVNLDGYNSYDALFDMQQMIQAEFIRAPHFIVRDSQFLKLNATGLDFWATSILVSKNEKLTASAANEFIKRCLLDLKEREYDFRLILSNHCNYKKFIVVLTKGLDVFSFKKDQRIHDENYPSELIVNSNWDDIKLELVIDRNHVKGKKIET